MNVAYAELMQHVITFAITLIIYLYFVFWQLDEGSQITSNKSSYIFGLKNIMNRSLVNNLFLSNFGSIYKQVIGTPHCTEIEDVINKQKKKTNY